jgi:sugar O-acyltransferase (sialic acid O-acetyltransferase NeuD family)
VIGCDSDLFHLVQIYKYALITIGQIKSSEHRISLYERALGLGFQLPVNVSPRAHVSRHATVGSGTIIMHGAIVNAGARIGNNCIINSRALVEHDAIVEDHCHISTGAILNGGVSVGSGSFVGSGSVIKQGVTVGRNCLIGMKTGLRHNLKDHTHIKGQENND